MVLLKWPCKCKENWLWSADNSSMACCSCDKNSRNNLLLLHNKFREKQWKNSCTFLFEEKEGLGVSSVRRCSPPIHQIIQWPFGKRPTIRPLLSAGILDLMPCDFFLWKVRKEPHMKIVHGIKKFIRRAVSEIFTKDLQPVFNNFFTSYYKAYQSWRKSYKQLL